MSIPVLKCEGLNKSYKKDVPVLQNFNCEIPSGKIVGLLGPNGCGKSTLMKLICGILVPDGGEIYVCGKPRSGETNALISYLPERTYFDNAMSVNDLIDFFADFYPDFERSRAVSMFADLNINTSAKLKTLSKGTQ